MDTEVELVKGEGTSETGSGCSGYSSMVHSKKVIKHALRQQAKRRRKNTTIAAGNSRTLPRIVVKPLPPPPPDDSPTLVNNIQHPNTAEEPAATMREVLASLPGFSLKSGRRRSTKRLSAAAQLEAGLVDLESPASILASTSLRALLNRHTFQGLPPLYQRKLAQLLPAVDRQDAATSGLNNEFFARACLEWRKRLTEGEFTPENQQRLKMEAERDKHKLDPWKLKHFEPIWGEKLEPRLTSGSHCITEPRSSGAVTRSSMRLRHESQMEHPVSEYGACTVSTVKEKMKEDVSSAETNVISIPESSENTEEMQQNSLQEDEKAIQILAVENHVEESTDMNEIEITVNDQPYQESFAGEQVAEELESQTAEITTDINSICPPERIKEANEEPMPLATKEKILQVIEEVPVSIIENNIAQLPNLSIPPAVEEEIDCTSQVSEECLSRVSDEQILRVSDDSVSHMSEDQAPLLPDEQISHMSDENNPVNETMSSHEEVRTTELIGTTEEQQHVINNQGESRVTAENPTDGEPQIPEGMEIDSETLQRIHELEVRGEMREAYEEISGCPEEIIYPILEGMEMDSNGTEEAEPQVVPGQGEDSGTQQDMNGGNEDEALREANNYVCSEMLECSWAVDQSVSNVNNISRTQEELQVPWPLVAAALDGSVAANITVTTQDECNDTTTTTDTGSATQRPVPADANTVKAETVNGIQLAGTQAVPFQSDTLSTEPPVTSCLMKSMQSQSPPIIAFPQLQSIRFVQTSFHAGQNAAAQPITNSTPVPVQIQTQQNSSQQVNVARGPEEVVQLGAQNVVVRNNTQNNIPRAQVQGNASTVCVQSQVSRAQNPIVVQHQTPIPTHARQVVSTVQQQPQQQQYPATVTASSRSARSAGQGGQRGSRSNNKEQSGGRSRSSTKEPPGAVNLERSYQICQAVIQSSPNRDQLKAHLKPPPSLLARGDGAFTTNKSGGRTITAVKTQKSQQPTQHGKQTQNKAQAVMLRHVFATARQTIPAEVTENNAVAQLGTNNAGGLGQYILVQRTGVGDGAPRASSAPPLPPQIAGMGVGVHLVRGRPASAGEGSHQAVTLKARGASDGRGGGGAEPGAPGVIMGGDPPPPCECNMRGAMVICRQCGAFCHDDCIGPQRICATCLIR
ncbi:polycomb protein Asx isoform X2 [Cephus cinctus]|uniref:Polycomb protein Asx isoform X2 n=1 Tax=Cephus cinctus TaxID=211228 RepID=A0AAJ7BQI3_CEPCN|nr:polycomb protein Asx isoform X2 [Cephus cinctus]